MRQCSDKQMEWESIASSEIDPGKQVLRPFDREQWSLLVTEILEKLELNSENLSFLDVGCGNGYLTAFFQSKIGYVAGVDFSPSMISEAKKNIPHGHFSVGNATNLEFDDNQFDRVLCYSIFHYFDSDKQVFDALDEICRVAKKGGQILIGDLLDKSMENEVKASSDKMIEGQLPTIKRYSEWWFVDLSAVLNHLQDRVEKVKLLDQNNGFATSAYRKDLKIWV